jgi:branched-chain amino acid transport system substrate-binding protein
MKEWKAFMKESLPELSLADGNNTYAYIAAQTMIQVLKQCGDDLSRANVMKQAASLNAFAPPLLLPGIALTTGPNDYALFDRLVLVQFNGTTWAPVPEAAVVSK